ncbi:MAG TPA: bifunctional hydroxymethylpyrimidine kinase/phosphomethylpyrimidine kinase [Rhizomicrobium sp.]
MNARPARILIVAGSDSSGGAGIQADIKTATALGCYAMTAITAVTAQNTTGVKSIHPIPAAIVREQIEASLEDIGADAIKIGMLGGAQIVAAVTDVLKRHALSIPLVFDPVMVATTGASLLDDDALCALKTELLPLATIVTPNAIEAERLTGLRVKTDEDCVSAGMALVRDGAKAALIKGGHLDGTEARDVLIEAGHPVWFASKRIETRHTHGTGCTLATAIACGLGQGLTLRDAVARAHDYVHEAIRTAPGFGAGYGPLNHMHGKID